MPPPRLPSSYPIHDPAELLTAQEAMSLLRISRATFYRLSGAGVVPRVELPTARKIKGALKTGRLVRYLRADIEGLLRRIGATDLAPGSADR